MSKKESIEVICTDKTVEIKLHGSQVWISTSNKYGSYTYIELDRKTAETLSEHIKESIIDKEEELQFYADQINRKNKKNSFKGRILPGD